MPWKYTKVFGSFPGSPLAKKWFWRNPFPAMYVPFGEKKRYLTGALSPQLFCDFNKISLTNMRSKIALKFLE